MRKTILASMLALAAFAVGSEARAAGGGWGMHSGETVRGGDNMLYGEVGWPDFAIGIQHGVSDKVDVGARLSLDYGPLYTTATGLGMGLRAPIRLAIAKGGKITSFFHIDPGFKFPSFGGAGCGRYGCAGYYGGYYGRGGLTFGIEVPIGFELGIHINNEATLQLGADIPFYLNLVGGVAANIPILMGFGFDYKIDDHMATGINTRFGPDIFAPGGATLGLIAQVYFAYRL